MVTTGDGGGERGDGGEGEREKDCVSSNSTAFLLVRYIVVSSLFYRNTFSLALYSCPVNIMTDLFESHPRRDFFLK